MAESKNKQKRIIIVVDEEVQRKLKGKLGFLGVTLKHWITQQIIKFTNEK